MKLCEMAQEYRVNVALLELRIKQLQAAQKRARQPEVRYRLKQRGFRQAFRTAFFRAMREQLTPRQYEVLWMIEVEGLSCKQCAERLGISPSAVSRHCSRGKKRLRTLLAYNLELRHQYFS